MLNFDEALARVLAQANPLGSETIDLKSASGRVLATPVSAKTDQPPFDGSAMDGYAVRSMEVGPGSVLTRIGESQAGGGFEGPIETGQCARIFTGAPLPQGADAVVMQEVTSVNGDQIRFEKTVLPGQNVRRKGQDFFDGAELVLAGAELTPARIALIAAGNVARIEVFKRPVIGLLATGDELVPPGSDLKPGQIVGSNSFGLGALLAPLAAEVIELDSAPDDEDLLRQTLKAALEGPADVIISTGGASVGDHDLVLPVLKSLGLRIDFWKIAMRPGKPIMFGKYKEKLFFALPGNPVSAHVTAVSVVIPALRAMGGYIPARPNSLYLPLGSPLSANGPRRHFMRCAIELENGQTSARPILQTDSSHLSSLAEADGLIVIGENAQALPRGHLVEVILL